MILNRAVRKRLQKIRDLKTKSFKIGIPPTWIPIYKVDCMCLTNATNKVLLKCLEDVRNFNFLIPSKSLIGFVMNID